MVARRNLGLAALHRSHHADRTASGILPGDGGLFGHGDGYGSVAVQGQGCGLSVFGRCGIVPVNHIVVFIQLQGEVHRGVDGIAVAAGECGLAARGGQAGDAGVCDLFVTFHDLPVQRVALRHRNHGADIERSGAALTAGVGELTAIGVGAPVIAVRGIFPRIHRVKVGIGKLHGVGNGFALLQLIAGRYLLAVCIRHGDGTDVDSISGVVHEDRRCHRKGLLLRKLHRNCIAIFRKVAQCQGVFAVGLAAFRPGIGFGRPVVDRYLPFLDHLTFLRHGGKDNAGAVNNTCAGLHRGALAGLCRQPSITDCAVIHGAGLVGKFHLHQKLAVGYVSCGVEGADGQHLGIAAADRRDLIVRGIRTDHLAVDFPVLDEIAGVRGRLETQGGTLALLLAAGEMNVLFAGGIDTAVAAHDLVAHRRGIINFIEAGAGKGDAVCVVQGGDVALLIIGRVPGQVHIIDAGFGIGVCKIIGAGFDQNSLQLCLITIRKRSNLISGRVREFQSHGIQTARDGSFPDGGDRQLKGIDG